MIYVIDSSALVFLANPNSDALPHPSGKGVVTHCAARVQGLLEALNPARDQMIIPTPVLSEVMIKAGEHHQPLLALLQQQRAVVIADFDQCAAVENALLQNRRNLKRKYDGASKKMVAFDLQVLAIARVRSADVLLSEDSHLRRRALSAGLQVLSIAELPIPESARQVALAL